MVASAATVCAQNVEFGLPVSCEIGRTCFVQQGPDMVPGPGERDPLCGAATYDGHDGWDIRVRWMPEIGEPVVAARDGFVVRRRDGVVDRLILSEADRAAVQGRECGNGIVIDHGEGWESQYCHLQNGSLSVAIGDRVAKGDRIGAIGASGLAQFPHVHFSVRQGNRAIDPLTGVGLDEEILVCDDLGASLLTASARTSLAALPTSIIAVGLSAVVPSNDHLMQDGPPPVPAPGRGPLIAWAWTINVEQGWRVHLKIADADGMTIADYLSDPLPRRKADHLVYAGRRSVNVGGEYRLEIEILDGDDIVDSVVEVIAVE